ncbi:hypothetical protein SAMN05421755_11411 [Nitrosomonas sp. Nm33]|nr:hypothetical protein SAMN05421755_11411 [Nitrosomonas sp. Nm33]
MDALKPVLPKIFRFWKTLGRTGAVVFVLNF